MQNANNPYICIMEIKLIRQIFTESSTIGSLYINNVFICFSLEDSDRRLENKTIKSKLYGISAVPRGTYELILNYSNKFKRPLPLLLNVPYFKGIRIHSGNTPADTFGCILCGSQFAKDKLLKSKLAFNKLFSIISKAHNKEKIFITIS